MNREQIQEIRLTNKLDVKLLKYKGVIGVDVNLKQVKGQKTDNYSITVYVKRKIVKDELSAEDAIPSEIEGIVTDVIECPNVWPSSEPAEQSAVEVKSKKPQTGVLSGGLDISNQYNLAGYGTLGIVALSNQVPTALSCAHVMLFPPPQLGQGVIEPSGPNGGTYPADSIGTVSAASYNQQNIDAALVPIQGRFSNVGHVQKIGNITGLGTAANNQSVAKMGVTTGLTQGIVVSTTLTWSYTTPVGPCTLYNQIQVGNVGGITFALPGDSGSVVVDSNRLMVGMVVAGVPHQFTVCNTSADLARWIPANLTFIKEE